MTATHSLSAWRKHFLILSLPTTGQPSGFWAAAFVGPAWLTKTAPTAVRLGGLPGWLGKRFITNTSAINVLASGEERLPMLVGVAPSMLDGQSALVCTYGPDSPWPWRIVRDEFRELSPNVWLGMTVLDLPGMRSMGWPFVLTKE